MAALLSDTPKVISTPETRNEFVDITQFKASQYLFARPNIRFLDPAMSSPITLGDAYWEHQQLQKQIDVLCA
jgi:hypothetical protein